MTLPPDMVRTAPLWVLSLSAALTVPLWNCSQCVGIGVNLMSWLALAASWVLFSGLTGYISLGHAVFYGLGAYVVASSWGVLPIWASLMVCGLSGCLLALVVGFPSLRVRGPYFVMLTFGLSELVKFVVIDVETRLQYGGRLVLGGPSVEVIYWILLGLAVAALALLAAVRYSRLGTGLRALREDEVAAETIGVPVTAYKIYAFALSAIIPAMVGGVMQIRSGYFEPLIVFDPLVSLTIICIAAIGGGDRPTGPVLGTIFLVGLSELLWTRFPLFYMVILGTLLLTFVLAVPQGLSGLISSWLSGRSRSSPAMSRPPAALRQE